MALALKSTFGCLNGPFNASGATDHDALLQAPELMIVRAEQIFYRADLSSQKVTFERAAVDRIPL